MRSNPITSIYDARLMFVTDVAYSPGTYSPQISERYAWVKAYVASGRHDLLIERARFEFPIPIRDWLALGERCFTGITVPELARLVAEDCGWSMSDLCSQTSIFRGNWKNTYPHLVTLIRVTISQEDREHEAYSWRSYRTRAERAALASPTERSETD